MDPAERMDGCDLSTCGLVLPHSRGYGSTAKLCSSMASTVQGLPGVYGIAMDEVSSLNNVGAATNNQLPL